LRLSPCANPREQGFALMAVLILITVGLAVLAGIMSWTSTTSKNSQRHTVYLGSMGITDSILERTISTMVRDYQANDLAYVTNHLTSYKAISVGTEEGPMFANFRFADLSGVSNQITLTTISNWSFGNLLTKYAGMKGYSSTFRLAVAGRDLTSQFSIPVAIQQDVQLASLSLFSFGYFYNLDMEICPSGTYTVSGRVHCNQNIYTEPTGTLTFQSPVTASGQILKGHDPDDPTSRTIGTVSWQSDRDGGTSGFALPIGSANSPDNLRQLVEIPPVGESATSAIGKLRYYNRADLVILLKTNGLFATSGLYNNFSTSVATLQSSGIITTNVDFYDRREYWDLEGTKFDVSKLVTQFSALTSTLGRAPTTIYFADLRPMYYGYMPGLRLFNAQTLPSSGLTIVTPHALYVQGHYNSLTANLNTTNIAGSALSSLVADAITVLSPDWSDADDTKTLSRRVASSTTVNAALIAGIVPSGWGYYSGGVENFVRLLEDWTSKQLTLNGSFVCLYDSRWATGPYGSSSQTFRAPTTRLFTWDPRFSGSNTPPSTPFISAAFKSKWTTLQSTNSF
jgi:hypothetical protein